MNSVNSLKKQADGFFISVSNSKVLFDDLIDQIENGLPPEVPMQPNELPGPYITRPYIVNIEVLAKGDKSEYDGVSSYAQEAVDFFNQADNRTLGLKKFRLVNFGRDISSEAVIEWGKQNGLYSPPMLYANDFARANPEVQKTLYVVALGEPDKPFVDGVRDRRVLVLDHGGDRRELSTRNWGDDWNGFYWVLLCE